MEFITLELRPRLQSCNVFIAMQKNLCIKNVRIKLLENSIVLLLEDRSLNFLLPSIRIIPTSLSMLRVINNWICFRLQTVPLCSTFGSYRAEVITDRNESIQLNICSQLILNNFKLLFKTSKCNILCTCCKSVISESLSFKRFLPLPDIKYDFNEWFCCKHSSNIISNNIQPQKSDYLYGSYFSILHKSIFGKNICINNKILTCNKCLLHIGMFHTSCSYKIWNCCVDYKPQNNTLNTKNATDPINDFLILVKKSCSEILGEEIILQTFIGKQTHCLLIKPMDHKLNLITETDYEVNNNSNVIFLQQKCVAKVLYKYEIKKVTTNMNYSNIKHHEVSLSIIEAGLNYLLSSTERLPHIYRNALTNYFLGYIILSEISN